MASDEAETAELIRQYLLTAAEHYVSARQLDLTGNRAVGRATNRYADQLRQIASTIGRKGPDAISAFGALLDEPRNKVQNWAAFHILEVMDAPSGLVDRAFAVLEDFATGKGVEAYGTRLRLRELREQFGR